MTLLSYDSTFEGFLTAVFEIYEFKYVNPKIIKKQDAQQNLFAEATEVFNNDDKSDRVIKKLEKQLGADGIRSLLYAFLSEIETIEQDLYQVIDYAVQNPTLNIMKDFANDAVLKIVKLTKSVAREKHRMEAFIRFELLKDGVYFAKIDPDFDVLTLIIPHFKNRYQDQKWMIYDLRRKYGVYYDLETITIITLDIKLSDKNDDFYSESEINYQKLWSEYFDHTNIKERKNTKLHLQHVPKRYWKYLTEKNFY